MASDGTGLAGIIDWFYVSGEWSELNLADKWTSILFVDNAGDEDGGHCSIPRRSALKFSDTSKNRGCSVPISILRFTR